MSQLTCTLCDLPATQLCLICGDGFCDIHSEKHKNAFPEFGDALSAEMEPIYDAPTI